MEQVCSVFTALTLAENINKLFLTILTWQHEPLKLPYPRPALTPPTSCLPPSPLFGLKSKLTLPTVPKLDPSSPLHPSLLPLHQSWPPALLLLIRAPFLSPTHLQSLPDSCTFPTVCPNLTRKHTHIYTHTQPPTHTHIHRVGAAGSL